jgi:hypothetical protein
MVFTLSNQPWAISLHLHGISGCCPVMPLRQTAGKLIDALCGLHDDMTANGLTAFAGNTLKRPRSSDIESIEDALASRHAEYGLSYGPGVYFADFILSLSIP